MFSRAMNKYSKTSPSQKLKCPRFLGRLASFSRSGLKPGPSVNLPNPKMGSMTKGKIKIYHLRSKGVRGDFLRSPYDIHLCCSVDQYIL